MKINLAKWEWKKIANMLDEYPMSNDDDRKPWVNATITSIRNQIESSEKFWAEKKLGEKK